MKTPVEQARELILNYDFSVVDFEEVFDPEEEYKSYYNVFRNVIRPLESVTNQNLHDSFKYCINIDEAKKKPKSLGYSKEGGYPHLPKNWQLPDDWEDFHFLAQLNISDFKHLDIENLFPEKGIIYLFQHFEEGDCKVYFSKEENELVERDDIEAISDDVVAMQFSAGWMFIMTNGEGDYGEDIGELIPKDLKNNIKKILNCNMQESLPSWGIGVKPNYWQGEDEDWDEEVELSNNVLLYQTEVDDSTIHFWVDKADLKSENLQATYQTFSGT